MIELGATTPLDLLRTYRRRMIEAVSPNDQMVLPQDALDSKTLPETDWAAQYFWVTEEALRVVVKAMLLGEQPEIRRILDLPCGHGRVLRGLRAAFPEAEITACDIDRDGVDFCARTFGARPVYGDPDPDRIDLGEERYDLIYCGSLLTHLDAGPFRRFLLKMSRHLAEDGLLVFTTHGRWCVTFHRTIMPFIAPDPWRVIEDGFRATGFGYHDYAESPGYGVSLTSVAWVQQAIEADPSLTTIGVMEKGLGNYQDVFVCRKWPIDAPRGPMHPKRRPALYQGETEMLGPPQPARGPRLSIGLSPELQQPAAPAAAPPPPAAEPPRPWLSRVAGKVLGR